VLREQQAETGHLDYVFASHSKTGYISAPKKPISTIIQRTGIEFSPHDLRRTFSTIAEAVSIPETLIRRLLNHTTDNNVTTGYIRTEADTVRQAAQKIADYIQAKATPAHDNVKPLTTSQQPRTESQQ
jgi:integrase